MNMVDTASGGALVNMTPQQARDLISTMAANSQQFRANPEPPRRVHQLSNSTLEDKVDRIANILNSLVVEKAKPARLCGICATPEHTTDACPSLNDDTMAHLDAAGNFPGPPQRRYDPYANTYNPGWRDHPNLSYGANPRYNQPYQNRKTEASIRELTISIEKLNSQGKLPSQTEPNPRQHANTVTLRSGKVLEPIPDRNLGQENAQENPKNDEQVQVKPPLPKIQPSFPGRLNQCRKGKEDKEILETFRNVEINLPLLDAIRQISRYAKFLKELCTIKRKLTGNEKVNAGENVSTVLQQKMPTKCKDRGMFAIPCKIGHLGIKKAMCDLGASINVMPFSVYESLNAGFLTKIGVIIQLADRSIVYPKRFLEDVLVKVNGLIFPADFYVIKMEEDNAPGSSDILLGRPFLSTANTKIDVRSGTLTMDFEGEIMNFNVYGTISDPSEVLDVNRVDIINSSIEKNFESTYGDKSKKMFDDFEFVNKFLALMDTKLLPSVVQERPLCTFWEGYTVGLLAFYVRGWQTQETKWRGIRRWEEEHRFFGQEIVQDFKKRAFGTRASHTGVCVGRVTQVRELHSVKHGLGHGHVLPFRMSTRPVTRACLVAFPYPPTVVQAPQPPIPIDVTITLSFPQFFAPNTSKPLLSSVRASFPSFAHPP
ncbi:hypothetical protein CXB51_034706 [Gossypium anomalum]|uniref:Retrotransposon gag domain-containing protein n=1 Tax=Gossypium anomalum TaxID=47600 RepID=A0A8J6CF74_9ROSI|nr:hypothetical protein CXB51_034706 [Gossypium anomalum]